ncbi:MAG: anti-sigma factor domain-containing protein [Rivularia sp. (in: cyanobacteria)]
MVNWGDNPELQELLASYVLGDLTSEEVTEVNKLLEQNPELIAEVNNLQETLALLPFALPENEPPADLGSQILQGAVTSTTTLNKSNQSRKKQLWQIIAATIAASIIVALGLYNYRLQQQASAIRQEIWRYQDTIALLRQQNISLIALEGTEDNSQAFGSFAIAPTGKAVLTLQNLPELPDNRVYRLWAVAEGKKIDCGDFEVNEEGKVLVQLPVDNSMGSVSSALVTVEPLQPVEQPTGEIVMRSI